MPAAATSRRPRWPEGVDRAHVFERIRLALRPNVTITDPPADTVVERDVAVPVRDGTVLRVNVFRPPGPGPFPTLLSLHPYGKDALPAPKRRGGYRRPFQMWLIPQSEPFEISSLTSWEAPDPAVWTRHGYAVVNGDLRGWGTSEGVGELLSERDGTLAPEAPAGVSVVEFDHRHERATFSWRVDSPTELVGPMRPKLCVEVVDADDVALFAGVRKLRAGRPVGFEGSYGFDRSLVTFGMRRAALREVLRLDVQGRWFFPKNPLAGQFPARYEPSPPGRCRLHVGEPSRCRLYVPTPI